MKPNGQSGKRPRSGWLTLAILGVAAVIVAVTVIIATKDGKPQPPVAPGPTEEEQVLAATAKLLASGDALSPSARPVVYQQARDLMLAYVRKNDDDYRVRPRLADLLVRMGDATQAEQVIDDAIRRHPSSSESLWMKGLLVRQRGQATYMKFFRMAAESPDATPRISALYGLELVGVKEFDAAEPYLQKALAGGATDVAVSCELGRILMAKDRYAQAQDVLLQAARRPGADWKVWRLLASAQKRVGKPEDAVNSLVQAASQFPKPMPLALAMDAAETYMELGQIRLSREEYTEAAEAFSAAASDHTPMRGEAAFEAAKCYHRLGRFGLALGFIDVAVKLMPGDESVKQWQSKIEDARFPRTPASGPASAPAAK